MVKIHVNNAEITVVEIEEKDYISLTDMVRNIDNGLIIVNCSAYPMRGSGISMKTK